jgi:ferritin
MRDRVPWSSTLLENGAMPTQHAARSTGPLDGPAYGDSPMNDQVQNAINEQINAELKASYTYLAMSAYCEHVNFPGCAKWLRTQSTEEYGHAMKLLDFMLDRHCRIELKAIEGPKMEFSSIQDVFETAFKHEQQVSRQIDNLYSLAHEQKAFAALPQLEWFLTEQVEEEKTARQIVAKFQLVKGDPASLLEIDRDLGTRTPGEGEG